MLAAHGISTTVADARFAKPLDTDLILRLARHHELLITIEEGAIGGFGAHVLQLLAEQGALDQPGFKVRSMVLPDVFIDHDTPPAMYAKAGLDANGIVAKVFEVFGSRHAPELQPAEIAVLAERAQLRAGATHRSRRQRQRRRDMKVILAQPRGFCAGVVRAIEIVERALEKYGPPVYVRHEIVHNKWVVDALKARGARFVEDLSEVPPDAITIFSAHGVAKKVEAEAQERGLHVLNATCPLVSKVHSAGPPLSAHRAAPSC